MRKQKEAKSGQQSALYAVTERFSQHNIGVFILLSATKDTNGNGKIAKPKITKISHFSLLANTEIQIQIHAQT